MKEPQNLLIRSWTPQALAFVIEHSITMEFNAGDCFYRDGETMSHFIFPNSGIIVAQTAEASSQSLEVRATGREGFVGITLLCAGGKCGADIKGLVAGEAILVPCSRLNEAAAQFPCVHHSLLRYGQFAILTLMQTVACIRSQSAKQIIACWLLQASDRLGGPDIAITHETLSNLLGLRRATVTSTFSKLAKQGIVETGRGVVRVADRDRLVTYGGHYYGEWQKALAEMADALPVNPAHRNDLGDATPF